jgi:CMP-N,N'-diacetyllegionaminic acid synthase
VIKDKSVLAIIPARAGSKRLPKKNLLPLSGKSLILWTIEAALASKYIDDCIISTDCYDIANIAKENGAIVPFMRPAELATDKSLSASVYIHAIESVEKDYDIVVFLQPTSPLRLTSDIDKSLELMQKAKAPSLVSVVMGDHPANWYLAVEEVSGAFETFDKILSNKDGYCSNSIYKFNGAIKAIYVKKFLKNKSFFSDKTITYVMPKSRSIDIDTNLDFVIAEYLINHTKK